MTAGDYRLKVCLGEEASSVRVYVEHYLDIYLEERPLNLDGATQSMIEQLHQISNLTDAEKKEVIDNVVWLVRLVVRFGQWEKLAGSGDHIICLSPIRHAYWFRVWCMDFLNRIDNDVGLRNSVRAQLVRTVQLDTVDSARETRTFPTRIIA